MLKKLISLLSKQYYRFSDDVNKREAKLGKTGQKKIATAVRLLFLRFFQTALEFFLIVFTDPSISFKILKKREEQTVCIISYAEYRMYSKKLKLFSLGGLSTVLTATLIISFFVSFIMPNLQGLAATYNWSQSNWNDGLDNAPPYPVDPTNQSNWTKYSAKDATVDATGSPGKLTVTSGISSTDTSDTDFDVNTNSHFSASEWNGTAGDSASVRLDVPE